MFNYGQYAFATYDDVRITEEIIKNARFHRCFTTIYKDKKRLQGQIPGSPLGAVM